MLALTPEHQAFIEAIDTAETYFRIHKDAIATGDTKHLDYLTDTLGVEITHEQLIANAKVVEPEITHTDPSRFHTYGTLSPQQRAHLDTVRSPSMEELLVALQRQQEKVNVLSDQLESATHQRDALIIAALGAGTTAAVVGKAIGISPQRVSQIRNRVRAR